MEPSFSRRKNILVTLGVTTIAATIAGVIRLLFFPEVGWQLILASYIASLIMLPLVYSLMRWINIRMEKVMPYETWGMKRFFVQLLIFIALALGTMHLLYYLFFSVFHFERFAPEEVRAYFFGKYTISIGYYSYIMLASFINLAFYTNYLFHKWRAALIEKTRLEVATAELEREKSRVQYENLKNQLNPHFLFNSFTSLNSLITKEPTLAQRFLQQLAKVYRHLLQNSSTSLVTLRAETDFVSNYIALQTTRFQQGLQVSIDIPGDYEERRIVPVTLQILIENAIKHNIIDAEQPLKICIYVEADAYLVIRNNIQLKKSVENSNKQGLNNLKRLYTYYNQSPVIVKEENGIFSVKIPLL
jgi:two-component system LytT family sensor kinase